MNPVKKIETAIRKLSVAEQRIIATHLDERLIDEGGPGWSAAADEGIRFLPQHAPLLTPRESPSVNLGKKPGRIADHAAKVSAKRG
jgi:hypothetical protein